MSDAYKKAGVNIDAGDQLVKAISPLAKATARRGANAELGGFGGLFDLKAAGFEDPILVSGADGVGTKLKLAFATDRHDTIGIDLVAMCANDILAQGAEPLFFLDYFATGRLRPETATAVIAGIAKGCEMAGCALIGGETAEMPGMYAEGEYDLGGFCVGAVERGDVLPREARPGDLLLGLGSSGAHSNGYSLIRKVIQDTGADLMAPAPFDTSMILAEALLAPTRIYVQSVLPVLRHNAVRGVAHITGGGLTDNVPRVLQKGLVARFDEDALPKPALFSWLQKEGKISSSDMRRTFNGGIGLVIVCDAAEADSIIDELARRGESPILIGDVRSA